LKKHFRKYTALALAFILSGFVQATGYAAELIGTEIVVTTRNQVIEVVAGGEAVTFDIEVMTDQNIPELATFSVDTQYIVSNTIGSSNVPSPVQTLSNDTKRIYVSAKASAKADAEPGEYQIRIRFSNITGGGNNAPKDNKEDYLTIRVVGDQEAPVKDEVAIDVTAPVVEAFPDRKPNQYGWYNQDVVVSFTAKDEAGGSGVSEVSTPVTVSDEGTAHIITGYAKDNAGNTGSASYTVNLDKTAPVISVEYAEKVILKSASVLKWTTSDDLSGLETPDSGTVAFDTANVGPKSVTITSRDLAGNETTKTFNYTVVYSFQGILQPINTDGSSVFKIGSTVPVKFQLKDAQSTFVSAAVAKLSYVKTESAVSTSINEAVSTAAATTDNLFRYDAISQQYIFNLSTKGLTEGSYQLKITLDDGQSHYVKIGLRK
jgi:hypothetical protein